jgi:hypothetical protein
VLNWKIKILQLIDGTAGSHYLLGGFGDDELPLFELFLGPGFGEGLEGLSYFGCSLRGLLSYEGFGLLL